MPLLSASFSVFAGLALVGLLAAVITFPTTAPTVATLLGLGVAIDYGLFLIARHREQLDHGLPLVKSAGLATATSGAAIVVAGGTVVVSILGLYVSGVPFVGAMGLASAIVVAVAMLAALTLMPAFMGLAKQNVRAIKDLRAAKRATRGYVDEVTAAARLAALTAASDEAHEHNAFARWGRRVSDRPWAIAATGVLIVLAIPLFSLRLGQLDAGTSPTSESIRRAYDLIATNFGPGTNGPLTVVVELPSGNSPQANQTLLANTQSTLSKTPGVAAVAPPSVNSTNTTAMINVVPATSPQNAATIKLANNLRNSVLPTSEVCLISRAHEAWAKTADAHRSVAIGIGSTARVITTAAAIMIVVFTSFVLDPDPTVKMLAIGMAAAVLIDASIIRMILVPAVISLLGRHAWWIPPDGSTASCLTSTSKAALTSPASASRRRQRWPPAHRRRSPISSAPMSTE